LILREHPRRHRPPHTRNRQTALTVAMVDQTGPHRPPALGLVRHIRPKFPRDYRDPCKAMPPPDFVGTPVLKPSFGRYSMIDNRRCWSAMPLRARFAQRGHAAPGAELLRCTSRGRRDR
jgi:hypothetical protein